MKTKTQQKTITALSLLICLFVSSFSVAQDTVELKLGLFEFETETIDYGEINKNEDGNRTFVFVNKGNSPIIISKVKSSCGCTVPSFSKAPVLPGEKGEITVKYATNRIGSFAKTLTIISNSSEPQKKLKIMGKILDSKSS